VYMHHIADQCAVCQAIRGLQAKLADELKG